ncbi:MAG TPA: hypothetical protein VNX01_01165 [Bacteroidia bacterium]|nr:hypothetical protein [Bacteroidia bacterium]
MSKKILAIYYTQTGQLGDIVNNFLLPFEGEDFTVEKVIVNPITKFTFPWSSDSFFDAMPESVLSKPTELQPFSLKETSYDLIVLGYQPWFLSPSIPTTSLLENDAFKKVLNNTPIVTIIGARNMWINAHERVKDSLKQTGAKLVGNIALVDKHTNLVSAVTILYWMMSGKKDKCLGIFPKPGVADEDILNTKAFGQIVKQHLEKNNFNSLQQELVDSKAIEVKTNLMFVEGRAKKLFAIWCNLVKKSKNRKRTLVLFKYYLIFALFIVAPIVLFVYRLLFAPFLSGLIKKQKRYFLGLSTSK